MEGDIVYEYFDKRSGGTVRAAHGDKAIEKVLKQAAYDMGRGCTVYVPCREVADGLNRLGLLGRAVYASDMP